MEEDLEDKVSYSDKQIEKILDDTIIALTQLKDLGDWVGDLRRDERLRLESLFKHKEKVISDLLEG